MQFAGALFRSYRESCGFTQQDIADKIGYSRQAVEKWENGKTNPKPETVKKLAKLLNVSVIDISDLPPEPETLRRLEMAEKHPTCALTGRNKCPFDDAPTLKKAAIEELIAMDNKQVIDLLAWIEDQKSKALGEDGGLRGKIAG